MTLLSQKLASRRRDTPVQNGLVVESWRLLPLGVAVSCHLERGLSVTWICGALC